MRSRKEVRTRAKRRAGFTLVDAMVVVLIMGVLASVGLNQYNKYVARAKRPEAVMAFRAIAVAQREYLLTWGTYSGTFDAIRFNVEGGARISSTEVQGRHYNYRIVQDDGPRSWYVIAAGNIDGDTFIDILGASNPR